MTVSATSAGKVTDVRWMEFHVVYGCVFSQKPLHIGYGNPNTILLKLMNQFVDDLRR